MAAIASGTTIAIATAAASGDINIGDMASLESARNETFLHQVSSWSLFLK